MSAQSANAIRYSESFSRLNNRLFKLDGTRLFDIDGGMPEVERVIGMIRATKAEHPRSRVFADACEIWASLIEQTAQETQHDNPARIALDWAVLQGSIYGSHALPDVPGSHWDSEAYRAFRATLV